MFLYTNLFLKLLPELLLNLAHFTSMAYVNWLSKVNNGDLETLSVYEKQYCHRLENVSVIIKDSVFNNKLLHVFRELIKHFSHLINPASQQSNETDRCRSSQNSKLALNSHLYTLL